MGGALLRLSWSAHHKVGGPEAVQPQREHAWSVHAQQRSMLQGIRLEHVLFGALLPAKGLALEEVPLHEGWASLQGLCFQS